MADIVFEITPNAIGDALDQMDVYKEIPVIDFDLTPSSIDKAIKELELFRRNVERIKSAVMEAVLERGVEILREEIDSLIYDTSWGSEYRSGFLRQSVHSYYDGKTSSGYICVTASYAKYVEFGTGIVGSNQPHPQASEMLWVYDINEHGQAGWVYYDRGRFRRTAGFRSRPFMYNTMVRLEGEIPYIVREVIYSL